MDPKHTHDFEQFTATLREVAASLAAYHDELMSQGFTRQEALALVVYAQNELLASGRERS